MVRSMAVTCLWTIVGFCGLYGPFTVAVVAKSKNDSSNANLKGVVEGDGNALRDGLETSQTRVNHVDGPPPSDGYGRGSTNNRVSGKDYDSGGGYPVQNTYGPPRDYYYDERPEYFRPHQVGGHHSLSGPSEVIYHQPPHPYDQFNQQQHLQHHDVHHPGELNVQPLLWPLAGITLLGVLSALVKTPLLLHLGTINGRRRRRRDVNDDDGGITAETIKSLLEKFNNKRRMVNPQTCLACDLVASIYDRKSACVERSVCEVMSRNEPGGPETDKRLLAAMIAQVIRNDKIPEEFKKRLESAETSGRTGGSCAKLYPCRAAETTRK